ncbi:MAG: DinB family protein [Phycisphaerae bacterium]|nr:DinB family protein [Phycisphaerae bacterium]
MKASDALKASLESAKGWMLALVSDIQDAPTTFPTSNKGNHPLWCLGHVIHSEAGMVSGMVQGKPCPTAQWEALFGMGSVPDADSRKYPSMAALLAEWEKVRAETLKVLAAMSDADLDKPAHCPPELRPMFGTVGQVFAMIGLHITFHAGQVADARRALGRKPLLA